MNDKQLRIFTEHKNYRCTHLKGLEHDVAGVEADQRPVARKWFLRNEVPEQEKRLHQERSDVIASAENLPQLQVMALFHEA